MRLTVLSMLCFICRSFTGTIAKFCFVILLLIQTLHTGRTQSDCQFGDSKDCAESESCGAHCGPKMSDERQSTCTSLAVVPYDEDSVLPIHKQHRQFQFAGHEIFIQQDWRGLGVAAVVWDAAEVLCSFLETSPDIVRGRKVLELGAGTGLVGIVAVLLGGTVTITDRQEVLPFLEKTVSSNLPSEVANDAKVEALDWTSHSDSFDNTVYDVVLGADIIYIEEVFEDLLLTLRKLSDEKTVVLLSCRIRYDRDTYFLTRLEEFFTIEKISYDKAKDVNLYKAFKRY